MNFDEFVRALSGQKLTGRDLFKEHKIEPQRPPGLPATVYDWNLHHWVTDGWIVYILLSPEVCCCGSWGW